MSQHLVDHAKQQAEQAGAPYEYFQGKKHRKELIVGNIAHDRGNPEGLLAVLCFQETCRSVKLRPRKKRPHLYFSYHPQRVLYYYFQDPEFGRMYVRIQTYFPFTVQVYVNGHDWLACQMAKRKLGFVQHANAFVQLDNAQQAQQLADRFPALRWQSTLNRWADFVNPLRQKTAWLKKRRYYWVIDQAELSTDVLFPHEDALRELYPRFLDHAVVNFSAQDVMTFLGRKLHGNFQGEVVTTCKKARQPGARIKHRMKNNWLKMYDKFGLVLRIETVINQPREFKVRRWRERNGKRQLVWCPMNKGIANFYQYHRSALLANLRYLDALSGVDDPSCAYEHVKQLVQRKVVNGRSYAGFNPGDAEEIALFAGILRGDHLLVGFRNEHLRILLYEESDCVQQRRRQSHAIGRRLKRLHVRGLIKKIPRTRRWQVTRKGQQILGNCVRLYYHGLSTAA